MKILVVSQYYYPEPFRITDICETLVKRGHDITVLTGLPNYPSGKILKEYRHRKNRKEIRNGVKIVRSYEHGRGNNSFNLIWNYFSFGLSGQHLIKKLDKDFDVVLINQLSPVMMAWPGIKYAKKYNKKILLYCYDLWPASLAVGGIKKKSLIYKVFNKISKRIYQQVDKIAVTSLNFIDYFKFEHKQGNNKLFYLPQYCEDIFCLIKGHHNDGIYNYVFAGNIGHTQSVETIIKAAKIINDDTVRIHIVGDGRNFDLCKKEAEGLNNVIFHGRKSLEEMQKFYEMADAMIVTMINDDLLSKTLPGKVQSYLASGKPIIGAINGECYQLIKKYNCGLVCKAEDYVELANIFIKFKSVDAKILSENSRKLYDSMFSKEYFFKTIERLLRSIYE